MFAPLADRPSCNINIVSVTLAWRSANEANGDKKRAGEYPHSLTKSHQRRGA